MASVWYIGSYRYRKISARDWQEADIAATEDSVWDRHNGWSIPESHFSQDPLDVLSADSTFLTGQADGPRTFPAPVPSFDLSEDVNLSAYAYYKQLKKAFEGDTSVLRGDEGPPGPGFAGLVVALDGTAVQGTVESPSGPVVVGDPVPVSVAWNSTVTHGSDENTLRPPVTVAVIWIGDVEPLNAIDGDIWMDTSGSAPSIQTTVLDGLHKGVDLLQVLVATGTIPVTWTVISGALPTGIVLSSSGELSGTPATEGQNFDFVVQATNGYGNDTQEYTGTIGAPIAPSIQTTALGGVVTSGVPYTQPISAIGSQPITFSIVAGTLPTGLTLNSTTGTISGTPTVDGAYDFTVRATNSIGYDDQQYTGTIVGSAPTIQTANLNSLSQGSAFAQTPVVVGSSPITWAVQAGSLPAGISLDTGTGELSGTPSASGAYDFTLRATNSYGYDDHQYTGIVASATPVITTTSIGDFYRAIAFSGGVSATGATPITFSVVAGTLPTGLSLDPSSGALSGTPTTAGAYDFTVRAENAYGTDDQQFTGTVIESLPVIAETSLNVIKTAVVFSQTLTATGYVPITWSVTAGTLPTGITLNPSTGELSGTPTGSGPYDFTVTATNTVGTDTQQFTGNVAGVPTYDVKGASRLDLGSAAANTPVALSINAAEGADVFVAITHSGGSATTSTPKYNGTNMVQVGTNNMYNPTVGNVYVWRAAGAGTGAPADVTFNTPAYAAPVNAITWSCASVSAVSTPDYSKQDGTTVFNVGPLSCPADQIRFCVMGMANQYTGFQDPTATTDYDVIDHTWPGPGSIQLVVEMSDVDQTTFFAGCGAGTSNFASVSFLVS